MKDSEYQILENIVQFMEKNGANYKNVTFNIDHELVEEIYESTGKEFLITELEKSADICLAHEWIKYRNLSKNYNGLGITEKGVGVVRSKRKSFALRNSRSLARKASDYIEDHKGLFAFLSITIALFSLLITLFKEK